MSESKAAGGRENDPDAALGAVIGELRRRAQLSQAELARRAELDEDAFAAIEAGRREATWGDLRRIAYSLDVPLPELLAQVEDLVEGGQP